MHVDYYPEWARHVNDYVYLGGPIKTISWRVRDHFRKVRDSIVERDGYACVHCGSEYNLEVHHKKPVWACIVDQVIPYVIYDERFGDGRVSFGETGELDAIDINRINSDDNLETVCRSCHSEETKRANRLWKERLRERRVVFGTGKKRRRQNIVNDLLKGQK